MQSPQRDVHELREGVGQQVLRIPAVARGAVALPEVGASQPADASAPQRNLDGPAHYTVVQVPQGESVARSRDRRYISTITRCT